MNSQARTPRIRSLAFLVVAVALATALGAPPDPTRYQGCLADDSAVPLAGGHNLSFVVFDAETGGMSPWAEGPRPLTLADGIVEVLLGEVTPLPSSVLTDPERWLALTVDGAVLVPHQELSSVPYAHAADRLGGMRLLQALDLGNQRARSRNRRSVPSEPTTVSTPTPSTGSPMMPAYRQCEARRQRCLGRVVVVRG